MTRRQRAAVLCVAISDEEDGKTFNIQHRTLNIEKQVMCDYFVISSISLSIVHVSVASFKPTAGVQPSVV